MSKYVTTKTLRSLILVIVMLSASLPLSSRDRKTERMERRKDLTTSVSQVNVQQEDVGSYANIGEYLCGRAPGLVVPKDASASVCGTSGACGVILIATRRSSDR